MIAINEIHNIEMNFNKLDNIERSDGFSFPK